MSGFYVPPGPGGYDPMIGSPEAPLMDQRVQKLVAHTPEEPVEFSPVPYYYICTMPNASMFRKDGTRIVFEGGVFETSIIATIRYLDTEMGLGNPFIRRATEAEVHEHRMKKDPRGTMKAIVREELEVELRAKLEAEIMERLGMLSASFIPGQSAVDAANKSGFDVGATDVAAHLKATKEVLKTDNATITRIDSPPPQLGGIVSSNDLGGAAAGSASSSPTGLNGFE